MSSNTMETAPVSRVAELFPEVLVEQENAAAPVLCSTPLWRTRCWHFYKAIPVYSMDF